MFLDSITIMLIIMIFLALTAIKRLVSVIYILKKLFFLHLLLNVVVGILEAGANRLRNIYDV